MNVLATGRTHLHTISTVLLSRFAGTALQLLFTVLLARALGAVASAPVFTWMAWSVVAAAVLSLGAPLFVLREVSKLGSEKRLELGGLYAQITVVAGAVGALIAVTITVCPGLVPAPYDRLLLFSVLTGHAMSILDVAMCCLMAIGRESLGIFLRFVCPPLVMCTVVLVTRATSAVPDVNVLTAAYVAVVLILAAIADGFYRRSAGPAKQARCAQSTTTRTSLWFINIVNALYMGFPFFVLPYFAGIHEIAYFAVGFRITNVAQTATLALGSYFAPRFARAKRNREARSLRKLFHSSQIASIVVLLPLTIFLTPLAPAALNVLGADFEGAWFYLAVPAAARLIIGACGLTEQFLAMTHEERTELVVSSLALMLLVVVGVLTASFYGALGLCVVFYGISVSKFAVTCAASLSLLYRKRAPVSVFQLEARQAVGVEASASGSLS